jgi:septation ring formation regulator EzrA
MAVEEHARENLDKWTKAKQELSQVEQKLTRTERSLQQALAEIERLKSGQS